MQTTSFSCPPRRQGLFARLTPLLLLVFSAAAQYADQAVVAQVPEFYGAIDGDGGQVDAVRRDGQAHHLRGEIVCPAGLEGVEQLPVQSGGGASSRNSIVILGARLPCAS